MRPQIRTKERRARPLADAGIAVMSDSYRERLRGSSTRSLTLYSACSAILLAFGALAGCFGFAWQAPAHVGRVPASAPSISPSPLRTGKGVTAVGLASDPVTGGYWILKSNGGVAGFHAPWLGSLAYKLRAG